MTTFKEALERVSQSVQYTSELLTHVRAFYNEHPTATDINFLSALHTTDMQLLKLQSSLLGVILEHQPKKKAAE